jgi:hypothetical protein
VLQRSPETTDGAIRAPPAQAYQRCANSAARDPATARSDFTRIYPEIPRTFPIHKNVATSDRRSFNGHMKLKGSMGRDPIDVLPV